MFRSSHNWGRGLEPRPTPWESGVFAGPPVWESSLLQKRYGCRGNPRGAEEAPLTFATSLISRPRSTFAGSSVDQGGERAVVSPEAFRGHGAPTPASGPEPGAWSLAFGGRPLRTPCPSTLRGMTAGPPSAGVAATSSEEAREPQPPHPTSARKAVLGERRGLRSLLLVKMCPYLFLFRDNILQNGKITQCGSVNGACHGAVQVTHECHGARQSASRSRTGMWGAAQQLSGCGRGRGPRVSREGSQ